MWSTNALDVLDVADLVGLEQQEGGRAVRWELVLGEEVRVAGGHDAVAHEPAGVAMVGVEAVALPRIVAEHDLRSQLANDPHDIASGGAIVLQVAIDAIEEAHFADLRPARRRAASRCSSRRTATNLARSADGSHVPFEPSVQTRRWTTHPAAAHLASVPPAPNSTSSGCAPIASADAGTGKVARHHGGAARQRRLARIVRSHVGRIGLDGGMGEIVGIVQVDGEPCVGPHLDASVAGHRQLEVAD